MVPVIWYMRLYGTPKQLEQRRKKAAELFEKGHSAAIITATSWPLGQLRFPRGQDAGMVSATFPGCFHPAGTSHWLFASSSPASVRQCHHCLGSPLCPSWSAVKEYLAGQQRLCVELLPAYAPELDPMNTARAMLSTMILPTLLHMTRKDSCKTKPENEVRNVDLF